MNTNFGDLSSLNNYLSNGIEKIGQSKDKHAEINNLIQVMRQNEGLINEKENVPQQVVDYLKLSTTIRNLSKTSGIEGNEDLDKVTRAASSVLINLGSLRQRRGKEVDPVTYINQIKKLERETYLQTLADWIKQNKVPLKVTELPQSELLELAPYLTYMDLNDNEGYGNRIFTDEFVGMLLEKAEGLTDLTITDSDIDGSAFDKFKNTEKLVSLEMLRCPHFNNPLPEKLKNLEKLRIIGCSSFNQPLPTGMKNLKSLTIIGCSSLNQPLPTDMDKLKRFFYTDPPLELSAAIRFLSPLMDSESESEEDRAESLAEGLIPEKNPNPFVYYDLIKEKPDQLNDIVAAVKKVGSGKLATIIYEEKLMKQVPIVEGDTLQKIFFCGVAAMLPRDRKGVCKSMGLLKEVLEPLIKTPMDPPLQQLYERLNSLKNLEDFLKFLKGVSPPEKMLDANAYLDLLAEWISKDGESLKQLGLSEESMLELAPHLTYLDLAEEYDDVSRFTPEFLAKLFEKTEKIETLRADDCLCHPIPLSRFKNTQHLQNLSIRSTVEYDDVLEFLTRIYISDSERGIKLASHCVKDNSYNEFDLLYYHFKSQNPSQKDTVHLLIKKIGPEKLGTLICRDDIPFVHEDFLKVDPEQQLFIYRLCSMLSNEKIPLVKQLLSPLIKSPMDAPLKKFYEFCFSNVMTKVFESNSSNDILAAWIAQDKVPLKSLGLTESVMLDLAPHLTYLDLTDKIGKEEAYAFNNEFLGKLLEKTEKLDVLKAEGGALDGETLLKLKNTQHLKQLSIDNCPSLQREHVVKFLMPIYLNDRLRAAGLASLDGLTITEADLLNIHFVSQNPSQTEAILKLISKITPERLGSGISRNDIPFVHEDLLKGDPLQQLLIYNICLGISREKLPLVRQFLTPLIQSPMDAPLQKFYEFIASVEISEDILKRSIEIVSTSHLDRDRTLKFLPFLVHVDAEKNLINLEKTGQVDLFLDKFPFSKETVSVMVTKDLFTENSEENAKTIKLISDLEKEFNTLKNSVAIPQMPWANEAESLAQTPAGKAFIKLHFHDMVMESQLQEIILRAFPPAQPENLAFYPMGSRVIGSRLEIQVVPTLPVIDAPLLLKTIVSRKDIKGIHIDYYGSPGRDASGLGRQFVSEVMQGYVINQRSLFTRTVGGEMYPFDPTHRLGAEANREKYKDLGMFLGLALQWEYPTGKVLSEKALNCMLAFTAEDLNNNKLDFNAFIAKMDSATFIQFMKEATVDDEDSIKLYEQVFLSDNPETILEAAGRFNSLVLFDDEVDGWIAGGAGNIEQIRERLRAVWVEDHDYSLSALHAMAQGMKERLPKKIGDKEIRGWEDVRILGGKELSTHLQGELTPEYVKAHIQVRVMYGETPEKRETADNVRKWTDEWIDANGNDPEKLANFVQAFSGARAMTKDILLDINSEYKVIEAHTCFNRADIPPGVKEGLVKMMWDDYSTGNFKFDVA